MIAFIIVLASLFLMISQIFLERKSGLLNPFVLFQVYFFIQLPLNLFLGTNFYSPRFYSLSVHTPSDDILLLGGYIIIGQLAFIAGYRILKSNFSGFSLSSTPMYWNKSFVNYTCVLLLLIGYFSFGMMILSFGGYQSFLTEAYVFRTTGMIGKGWMILLFTSLMSVASVALLITNEEKFRGKAGIFRLFILFVICILPATQLGYRSFILIPFLQFLFFYNERIQPIKLRSLIVPGTIFLIVFTLFGIEREIPFNNSYGSYFSYLTDMFYKRPDLVFSTLFRSMGADISLTTIQYMKSVGDFKMLYPIVIESSTIFVPGSLWPDKPTPLSVQYSREVFNLNGGVSPTVIGEGFWHAGVLGVVIICFVSGLICRYFQCVRAVGRYRRPALLLCISIFPSAFLIAEAFQGYLNSLVILTLLNFILIRLFMFGDPAVMNGRRRTG